MKTINNRSWWYVKDGVFSPIHWPGVINREDEITVEEAGFENIRYLFYWDDKSGVYSIESPYTKTGKVDSTYKLRITGRFFHRKYDGSMYYNGGFSIT